MSINKTSLLEKKSIDSDRVSRELDRTGSAATHEKPRDASGFPTRGEQEMVFEFRRVFSGLGSRR